MAFYQNYKETHSPSVSISRSGKGCHERGAGLKEWSEAGHFRNRRYFKNYLRWGFENLCTYAKSILFQNFKKIYK